LGDLLKNITNNTKKKQQDVKAKKKLSKNQINHKTNK
jgi:hypothetical protein